MKSKPLKTYSVWDKSTRIFHWLNFLTILVLIGVGLVILNAKSLGVSVDGKVLLKKIHVYAGYVFALNLGWRLIWGFVGSSYARWRAILPGGRGYWKMLTSYVRGGRTSYLGHNPLGRIAVTVLMAALCVQAVTGLILAGTDLYFPPFGGWISEWVAAPGVDPATLQPYAKDTVDAKAYAAMRDFRSPIISTHVGAFYTILVLIILHIAAVIWTEIKHGGNIISAMFTGEKSFSDKPVEEDDI